MTQKVLILGGSGQAGHYLAQHLLAHNVGGGFFCPNHRDLNFSSSHFSEDFDTLLLGYGPDIIFNFAAVVNAAGSWSNPAEHLKVNAFAVTTMLESIRRNAPHVRFFQASSASMYGQHMNAIQETSHMSPDNPYGLSKVVAHQAVQMYRRKGIFACSGIFFNAESPRRSENSFTRKVAREAARLKRDMDAAGSPVVLRKMELGRLDFWRDWGWMPDYVGAAWDIASAELPEDWIVATGQSNSAGVFVTAALRAAGLPNVESNFDHYVSWDKQVSGRDHMMAAPLKIQEKLGWRARFRMDEVARMLVEAETKEVTT